MTSPAEREFIPRLQVAPKKDVDVDYDARTMWGGAVTKPRKLSVFEREPVRAASATESIPIAMLTCLVAFNVWSPTDIQWVALLGLWTALSMKVSELARGKVWSPASHAQAVAEAARR